MGYGSKASTQPQPTKTCCVGVFAALVCLERLGATTRGQEAGGQAELRLDDKDAANSEPFAESREGQHGRGVAGALGKIESADLSWSRTPEGVDLDRFQRVDTRTRAPTHVANCFRRLRTRHGLAESAEAARHLLFRSRSGRTTRNRGGEWFKSNAADRRKHRRPC